MESCLRAFTRSLQFGQNHSLFSSRVSGCSNSLKQSSMVMGTVVLGIFSELYSTLLALS